jgi:hypothetical protein
MIILRQRAKRPCDQSDTMFVCAVVCFANGHWITGCLFLVGAYFL